MELRSRKSINYRQYADLKLPRAEKISTRSTAKELFPVSIVDSEDSGKRVKIHYVGYPIGLVALMNGVKKLIWNIYMSHLSHLSSQIQVQIAYLSHSHSTGTYCLK